METMDYFERLTDSILQERLEYAGAVLIEGAKWCGKTSTAKHAANSVLYMQDPDRQGIYLEMARARPSGLLTGEVPRLIDEWQMAPHLWDAVRFTVDQRNEPGQFILTGSAVPVEGATFHSGTGRISRLRMRPMSLFESRESSGEVSLKALFDGELDILGNNTCNDLEHLAFLTCRGGWPYAVIRSEKFALRIARDYVHAIIHEDVRRLDGVERHPQRLAALMRALARNTSTLASGETVMADVAANDMGISPKTYQDYINALQRIFVVENMPAWAPSLRSKTAIRTSEKLHFVDPSLAAASLGATPKKLLKDLELFGFLFESLCARDLRVYMDALDGSVGHYRDKTGLEADMILHHADGRWAAVEVKLGTSQVDAAAASLLKLRNRIDTDKVGEPAFLMVLTGLGSLAYRRGDGVLVVPIASLRL